MDKEIEEQPIMYAKFGSKDIAIWNPYMKRWDIKLHFGNNNQRERWWNTIDDHQKATLKDRPFLKEGE